MSQKHATGDPRDVFRLIPKLDVVGSNPVGRSKVARALRDTAGALIVSAVFMTGHDRKE